jgi:beta-xylosidase
MLTYQNPVYPYYFADPFVWKFKGKYFAVGTGVLGRIAGKITEEQLSSETLNGEERAIPLLISDDFVNWKFHGPALIVPPEFCKKPFWAPEVAYDGSHFYLYYSTAISGLRHQLRVAKSKNPDGPFEDVGHLIGGDDQTPFAIDAHPFLDDSGDWFLFYARDFLNTENGSNAGTALVVDRLVNMTKLAGEEKIVLRSHRSWQLFKAQREMYGKIWDWHTLEGPTVRKHNGLYYCFFSGGCYENETYGVEYCVSEKVSGPYSDAGNELGPRVLKTVVGKVVGPGHNSIITGPDGVTDYMVYHAWDLEMTARRMCFDRLIWTENGPRCLGPTTTPQQIPENKSEAAR